MSLSLPLLLADPAETLALGEAFAQQAKPGQVIALVGNLGAGKTTFTQGLIRELGYEDEVTSPTFSLVQEYHGGDLDVYHFDFYRAEQESELLDLGWDDYVERGGLVIVEWPALFPQLFPPETFWLKISHRENERYAERIDPSTL